MDAGFEQRLIDVDVAETGDDRLVKEQCLDRRISPTQSSCQDFWSELVVERFGSELAVERATVLVGPALILTTVVLACGLIVTVFSDLPSLRLFGWLSAFSMVAALVADLFILRPTAMWLINFWEKIRGRPAEGF